MKNTVSVPVKYLKELSVSWVNKDTEIYCSFAKQAGNTGCQMMNSAFFYYNLNKIYKSFSVDSIEKAVQAVRALNIKGFAITMPYKIEVLQYVDEIPAHISDIGAANTVINTDGRLKAYNTDYNAAQTVLQRHLKASPPGPLYILGNGGYAQAVKCAAKSIGYRPTNITRNRWADIQDIRDSIIYNCTPVEQISVHSSNDFIDCIVSTDTGIELATIQAAYQFKLYTDLKFPFI